MVKASCQTALSGTEFFSARRRQSSYSGVIETLIEDKMVVALERVAVDDRVGVMVLLE